MMKLGDLSVTHAFADVGGLKLHYVEKGEGPVVLLLHGFPEMWWSWRYQIDALASAGYRVIAPDLRGYNESDKQGPYDLDTLATDVRALVAFLGIEKVRLVGHDWGGGLAWHVASKLPSIVEKLVVLNCPHPAQMVRALKRGDLGQLRRSWYMFFFQLPLLPERMLTRDQGRGICKMYRASAVDPSHFSDEELAPFVENVLRPGAVSAMIGWYRAAFTTALKAGSKGPEYAVIRAPTMLIWAKDDTALGYDSLVPGTERLVEDLRLEPIDRCGHFVQAEQPARVNKLLIEFLAKA
ncbi:MAG: alpha/beta hydrolase [Polyangiales bacterium]